MWTINRKLILQPVLLDIELIVSPSDSTYLSEHNLTDDLVAFFSSKIKVGTKTNMVIVEAAC